MSDTYDENAIVDLIRSLQRDIRKLSDDIHGRTKPYLTVEELAEMTGRASYTVRRWIREGRIRAERLTGSGPKGRLLIPRDEVNKLIVLGKGGELPSSII